MKKMTFVSGVLLTIAAIIGLAGCGNRLFNNYVDAEKYSAGNAEINGKVNALCVNWTSGKVTLAAHDSDTVLITETATGNLSDDQMVHWYLDGTTLRIHYSAAGKIVMPTFTRKDLTITLPAGVVLNSMSVSTTSADISGICNAKELSLDSTSGDMCVEANAQRIHASSTSGGIDVRQLKKCDSVELDSTSGRIQIESNGAHKVTLSTTSGGVTASLMALPDECEISSVSGSVKLKLSEEPTHTSVKTVSGKYKTTFADGGSVKKADGNETYMKVSTTSGSVTISGIED